MPPTAYPCTPPTTAHLCLPPIQVSSLLSGPEGVPISLQFERIVRDGADGRTRTYDVALRRERFYLDDDDDDDDAMSESSRLSSGGARAGRRSRPGCSS